MIYTSNKDIIKKGGNNRKLYGYIKNENNNQPLKMKKKIQETWKTHQLERKIKTVS